MRVLFITPEAVPFAKTGGLADVCGALPNALAELGCDVRVVMPFHGNVLTGQPPTRPSGQSVSTSLPSGKEMVVFDVYEPGGAPGDAEFILLRSDNLFGRRELYVDPETGYDWQDNDIRFLLFSKAALQWALQADFFPDILHVHDWQAAPATVYLKTQFAAEPALKHTKSVLTIHNLAYQGTFPAEQFANWGLAPALFHPLSPFEFYGKVNFLKAGLHYADVLTTVSPTYAREIQSGSDLGAGLDGVLRDKADRLFGIVNGIDSDVWNPRVDRYLPVNYGSGDWTQRRVCKNALFARAKWAQRRIGKVTIGMISRLVDQKGFDLLADAAARLFSLDVQLALLGRGDEKYHKLVADWTKRFSRQFFASHAFDESLAHLIEAGSDIFLMPSRFEPCGLNQMYSMAYGTVPVVRATGGLADTVTDADAAPERGTGFVFSEYTAEAMLQAIQRALTAFRNKQRWRTIQERGMAVDFSWSAAAANYKDLYERTQAM